MYSKLLSPFLDSRLQPARKFPQLRLKAKEHGHVTRHRRGSIPLSSFHEDNVSFITHEHQPGQILEVRRDDQKLLGLGAFEPQLGRVDLFYHSPTPCPTLPVISEDFFVGRLREVYDRRWRRLAQARPHTNAFRLLNGAVDGLPGLVVDGFSRSFLRVVATTALGERLLPALAEFLREAEAEALWLDSPTLGRAAALSLRQPTLPLPQGYAEGGAWLRWPGHPPGRRRLLQPAHRRARQLLREVGAGRRVLCIHDGSGAATLSAVLTAKRVVLAEADPAGLAWVREGLVYNHGAAVFEVCETVQLRGVADLWPAAKPPEVVYLEHHPRLLATKQQWCQFLTEAMAKGVIGAGTILITTQEAEPLGIPDLGLRRQELAQESVDQEALDQTTPSATRDEMVETILESAEACQLRARVLRTFASSWDFPTFPEDDPACFSHVCLIEEPLPGEAHRETRNKGKEGKTMEKREH